MNKERRRYPRVLLNGDVELFLEQESRPALLLNVSPTGAQLECRHQLIQYLTSNKNEAGMYPPMDIAFSLPQPGGRKTSLRLSCAVSYCRRLSQDCYHLGLDFGEVSGKDEQAFQRFIDQSERSQWLNGPGTEALNC
ncbi:MAG: PilZ domain-containing protein [Pseudohongiellaceae bacterium]